MAGDDTYKLDRVIKSDNAIVRVYRPDITDSERQKRMEAFIKATADFMSAGQKEKRQMKN